MIAVLKRVWVDVLPQRLSYTSTKPLVETKPCFGFANLLWGDVGSCTQQFTTTLPQGLPSSRSFVMFELASAHWSARLSRRS